MSAPPPKLPLNAEDRATLAALARGIIPPDDIDAGADAVEAGPRLAAKIEAGINAGLYLEGLAAATAMAREQFGQEPGQLSPAQVHQWVGGLRERAPGFYKQLRMDVSALYLSEPKVWERIGFPGPSSSTGGYPDFDQNPDSES
jgi:hypothetical protein